MLRLYRLSANVNLNFSFVGLVRDRGSVSGASTRFEIGGSVAGFKQFNLRLTGGRGVLLIQPLHFFLVPAHAGEFDFALGRNPEHRGTIAQPRPVRLLYFPDSTHPIRKFTPSHS